MTARAFLPPFTCASLRGEEKGPEGTNRGNYSLVRFCLSISQTFVFPRYLHGNWINNNVTYKPLAARDLQLLNGVLADQFARPSGIIIITTSSNRRAHYDNYLFRSCGCRIYQLFGSGSIIQRRSFSAAVRRATAVERRTVDYPANDSQFPSSCCSLLLLLFLNKINDSASFDCREGTELYPSYPRLVAVVVLVLPEESNRSVGVDSVFTRIPRLSTIISSSAELHCDSQETFSLAG